MNKPFIISDYLTFGIPVRIDSKERKDNLRTIVSFLSYLKCRLIVLEASSESSLKDEEWIKQVEYVFIEDKSLVFHRTHYINELLRMVDTDIAAVWDTDVLVDYPQIYEAVEQIQKGCTIAYPYNGQFVMLSEQMSVNIRKSLDLEYLRQAKLSSFLGRKLCGGAYFVHRQRYLQCGGENERFTGWGPEDAERMHRVKILGHNVLWTAFGQLYHLYHPRGTNSCYQSESDADRLRCELVNICSMDRDELSSYVSSSRWNNRI